MMKISSSSLATERARIKGLGAAKSGTKHFWHQRVSGVALVPLTLVFVVTLISLAGASHAQAVAVLKNPFIGI
jgi:succinate dehydrogenase / fumarate reductase membrane anchor subunit